MKIKRRVLGHEKKANPQALQQRERIGAGRKDSPGLPFEEARSHLAIMGG